jgi:hypothetical protein
MDLFILQIAIIFVPGIIWERIDSMFALGIKLSQFDIIRRSFSFGLAAYVITYSIYSLLGRKFEIFELRTNEPFLSWKFSQEILAGSLVALLCSIAFLYIMNYKLVHRALQAIGATRKFGNEDAWDFTFSLSSPNVEYVHFRDFDRKITYAGWVELFSETDKIRELVLRDAIVYDFYGEKLFECPRVYVARPVDKIDIEFPYREAN